jgi:ParB family chromosome partitioning protein
LQPILVRPRPAGGFEIVAGERRYRAARRAGLASVPVMVRSLSDDETLALALVENLLREDITPLETARAFRRLIDDYAMTQEELSRRVGKSRAAVANSLRLLDLPAAMQESLEKGELTEGHARALLAKGATPALQRRVWQMTRNKGLSVRDVERLMKQGAVAPEGGAARGGAALSPASASNDLAAVEDRLRGALAMKVRIVGTEKRGRVEIEYHSGDELDALVQQVTVPRDSVEPGSPAPAKAGRGRNAIHGLLSAQRPG